MRSILDRYVFFECLPTLGLSLAVFSFALLMQHLFKLSDLVLAKGVPVLEVGLLLLLSLPALMPLLLPVSLLLAVLLAMGRLSGDSEIVAMRAGGIGLFQNLRPVMVLSALTAIVTAALSLWVQPVAASAFKEFLYTSVKNRIGLATETGVFTEIADGITVYAGGVDPQKSVLTDLFLEVNKGPAGEVWILARSGSMGDANGDLSLDLHDGEIHHRAGARDEYQRVRFERYRLRIPLPAATWALSAREATTADLIGQSYRGAASGSDRTEARLELHRRFALPISCLILGALATALGLHHARGGKSRGVTLCLLVLMFNYVMLTIGEALGKRDQVPPEVAVWFSNVLLGALAWYAIARKNREAPLPLEDAIARGTARLRARWFRKRVRAT